LNDLQKDFSRKVFGIFRPENHAAQMGRVVNYVID
jgi:hypothetical protein